MYALIVALVLAVLCSFVSAEVIQPPKALVSHIVQQRIVHDGKCDFNDQKDVECLVFMDEERQVVWGLMFDENMTIYAILARHNGETQLVWLRTDA